MCQSACVLFPVASVEGFNGERARRGVEAADVDVDPVRVRAGYVERFDAAGFAERVFGCAGVEGVGREVFCAACDAEFLRRHDEVQEARLRAQRAIAVLSDDVVRRFDLERDGAAVA